MLGGAVLALTTTLNGLFIMATKSVMAIAGDRLLPARLGRVNRRLGTAPLLYLVIWIVSVAGVLSNLSLETFASYAALGGMVVFIPVLIASLALPRRYPERYRASAFKLGRFFRVVCPVLGAALAVFLCLVILADLGSPLKIGLFLAFAVSGLVYYEARRRFLLRRGFDIVKNAKSDDLAKP